MPPFRIRPATPADLSQIQSINTHYILNTVLTFRQQPFALSTYEAKLTDLNSRGLPFLVTIDDSREAENKDEVVLGYTYLSPFRGSMHSYAATVELSLFGVKHLTYEDDDVGVSDTDSVPLRSVLAVMAVEPEGVNGCEALRRWYIQPGFVERGRMEKAGFKRGYRIEGMP
ncbi:hypothetical protein BDV06DRAFT_218221 [Aspergillus oleicola]